jgi:hypothetical protein
MKRCVCLAAFALQRQLQGVRCVAYLSKVSVKLYAFGLTETVAEGECFTFVAYTHVQMMLHTRLRKYTIGVLEALAVVYWQHTTPTCALLSNHNSQTS